MKNSFVKNVVAKKVAQQNAAICHGVALCRPSAALCRPSVALCRPSAAICHGSSATA